MDNDEWDMFSDLLEAIVNAEGSWQVKAKRLAEKLEERGSHYCLAEIVGWFDDEGQVQQP